MHRKTVHRKIIVVILLLCIAVGFAACTTAVREIPANAIVLKGKMNPVSGGRVLNEQTCWALEVGVDLRSVKYYQLIGDKDVVKQLYEEDMMVTVRVVPRPDEKTVCPIGTVVELLEIMEARTKRD